MTDYKVTITNTYECTVKDALSVTEALEEALKCISDGNAAVDTNEVIMTLLKTKG